MTQVGRAKNNELVKLDDDLVNLVKDITKSYDKEDRTERDSKRALWLKLENYFAGKQRQYWDMTARNWKDIEADSKTQTMRHYDKVINIYRAHGESIIAALSIKPPSAIFFPNDADVEEDVITSRVCVKIKENIERQNNVQLLLIKALAILFNQGTVASYIYNRKSSVYGTYSVPKFSREPSILHTTLLNCYQCGSNLDEVTEKNRKPTIPEEPKDCPVCGFSGIPVNEDLEEEVPEIIGSSTEAKSKTEIEVYGPLFVYIPFYARRQENCPYIRLKFDAHYSALKNLFPKLAKKGFVPTQDNRDPITISVDKTNLCTVECWWIRDWAFDIIDQKDHEIKKLKEKFPDGIYAVIINDELVEVNNENLDDHWEISSNPLSTYMHGEPLGKPLAPIQDLENEIVDLQIETFEHAIPETWADSRVVDFEKYGSSRAAPGMMYPANPPPDGTSLQGAFHTIKTATLSEEAELFLRKLDDKGQFVTGSFPSIYGGPATSGSKTAREYTESRAMALQRLGIVWNIIKYWWAGTMSKAVPLYIHALRATGEDEKIVEKNNIGFTNVWIKQSDLDGKIGRVEADAQEDLPQTPGQLKDLVVQLLTLKDEYISQALYHPQNLPLLTKALGAPDFFVPNSDDRDKQFMEFSDLLAGIPVEVNFEIDDHDVEAEVCRTFLVSATGLMIAKSNPEGRKMIEEHYLQHIEAAAKKNSPSVPGNENPEEVNDESKKVPAGPNVTKFPARS